MKRRRIRVVIAEDDASVREALSTLIEQEAGLRLVGAADNGRDATELVVRNRADVVLLDVRMPGGGPNLARRIKRRSPQTKILALTASDDRSTVLEMVEAGVVGYLVKGVSVAEIVESIGRAAMGQSTLSADVTSGIVETLADQLAVHRRAAGRLATRKDRIQRVVDDESALRVVFQPIVALADGAAVGAEALARFAGPPRRGPAAWFSEASEVGMLSALEMRAATLALASIASLPDGTYVSVNVSPATLASAAFRRLIEATDAARIVIEVTEHAPIPEYARVRESFERFRTRGARLAVDDVGAGFASLSHILRLEPDVIKLDASLIKGIERDQSRQALAVGLISFADRLGTTIVAEGVEHAAQVQMLEALGVRFAQGFYLGRPEPLPLRSAHITRRPSAHSA